MSVTRLQGRVVFSGRLDFGPTASARLSTTVADRLDLASGDTLRLVGGTLDMGADVQVVRTGANLLGLATGDAVDLMTNNNNLQLPGGTTAIGTTAMGTGTQRLRVGTNGGTVVLALELGGTTFFFNRSGNL